MDLAVPVSLQDFHARDLVRDVPDVSSVSAIKQQARLSALVDTLVASDRVYRVLAPGEDALAQLHGFVQHAASVGVETQERLLDALTTALTSLTTSAEELLGRETREPGLVTLHRNSLRLVVYLCYTGASGVSSSLDKTKVLQLERSLAALNAAVTALLSGACLRLWHMSRPEDAFVRVCVKLAVGVLEQAVAMKREDLRRGTLDLLRQLVAELGQAASVAAALMHALPRQEHVGSLVIALVEQVADCAAGEDLLMHVLDEVCEHQHDDMARDTAGARNLGTLLADMAGRVPRLMLPHVATLELLLDAASYHLRSGAVYALAAVVPLASATVAAPDDAADKEDPASNDTDDKEGAPEDDDDDDDADDDKVDATVDAVKSERDTADTEVVQEDQPAVEELVSEQHRLVQLLLTRHLDKNPFTRGAVLKALASLLTLDTPVVATSLLPSFAELAAQRIADKTAHVRKYALLLLVDILRYGCTRFDPRTASLARSGFASRLAAVQATPVPADATAAAQRSVLLRFYAQATEFLDQVQAALTAAQTVINSRNATDVIACVAVFLAAADFHVDGAGAGVRHMLHLVWRDEAGIQAAVLDAYAQLYTSAPPDATPADAALLSARRLAALPAAASLGELTSLEEVMQQLAERGAIRDAEVHALWDLAMQRVDDVSREHSGAALALLTMLAAEQPRVLASNLTHLVTIGNERGLSDPGLAKWVCMALKTLAPAAQRSGAVVTTRGSRDGCLPSRLPSSHPVIALLLRYVQHRPSSHVERCQWHGTLEQALSALFALAQHPDVLASAALRVLAARATAAAEQDKCSSADDLATLFMAVGHCALKMLVFMEATQRACKARRAAQAAARRDAKAAEKKTSSSKDRKSKGKDSIDELVEPGQAGDEDEDDAAQAGYEDDVEDEFLTNIADNDLLYRDLLGSLTPLVVQVCSRLSSYASSECVQRTAVLALCKLMLVSEPFCRDQLQLLVTLLSSEATPSQVRGNIMVAFGDLASRFPNAVEPWTPHIYARLRDPDMLVRKHTLLVLTHLILNDLIKVRGQISGMLQCLEDGDERVRQLASVFLHQLSRKDSKGASLFNIVPDIISRLCADPHLRPDAFRRIIDQVLGLVTRDKQCEGLVERVCHRFGATKEPQHWEHLAYCLAQIPLSERSAGKLNDLHRLWRSPVRDEPGVRAQFDDLLAKARKTPMMKPELKMQLDLLEARVMLGSKTDGDNGDEAVDEDAQQAAIDALADRLASERAGKRRRKQPAASKDVKGKSSARKQQAARRRRRDSDESIGLVGSDADDDDDAFAF